MDIRNWLESLPGWAGAEVRPLSGGQSNDAFKLTSGSRSAVLKIDAEPKSAPANTRAQEAAAQRAAAEAGLAADVYWFSREGILSGWVDGSSVGNAELHQTLLDEVGRSLRRLHALPLANRNYDYRAWGTHYRNTLEARGLLDASLESAFERVSTFSPPGERVFSHNDLVPANLVRGDTLLFIDFEYASDNTPLFDLATLIVEAELGDKARGALIDAYFESNAPAPALIDDTIDVYRAMKALWEASRLPVVA